MPDITQIMPPRVPLVDERTGLISREWSRFFFNQFEKVGSSGESLEDLQLGPVATDDFVFEFIKNLTSISTLPAQDGVVDQIAEIQKQIQGLQLSLSGQDSVVSQIAEIEKQIQGLNLTPTVISAVKSTTNTLAPFNIPLTGSPFTYQNTNSYVLNVLVGSPLGGVTNLEFSRDGTTFYSTGSFYGQFTLNPLDYLRVTYTVAPTLTGVPQ